MSERARHFLLCSLFDFFDGVLVLSCLQVNHVLVYLLHCLAANSRSELGALVNFKACWRCDFNWGLSLCRLNFGGRSCFCRLGGRRLYGFFLSRSRGSGILDFCSSFRDDIFGRFFLVIVVIVIIIIVQSWLCRFWSNFCGLFLEFIKFRLE